MATNGIARAESWRVAARTTRAARAVPLRLPSGTTILAAKPEPLEWILSGRIPQRLLAVAIENRPGTAPAESDLSREDVLDLARFATQLVRASVVEPAIGDGPGEISLDDIPVEDRAFIFQWACRALGEPETESKTHPQEDVSSAQLERFCAK